jgi:hypothetical protein
MQFHCQHCNALIRLVNGKIGCPNGCEQPIKTTDEKCPHGKPGPLDVNGRNIEICEYCEADEWWARVGAQDLIAITNHGE